MDVGRNLYKKRLVMKTYDLLKKKGLVVEKDDAYWLDMSKFNQKNEVFCAPTAARPIFFPISLTIWKK